MQAGILGEGDCLDKMRWGGKGDGREGRGAGFGRTGACGEIWKGEFLAGRSFLRGRWSCWESYHSEALFLFGICYNHSVACLLMHPP